MTEDSTVGMTDERQIALVKALVESGKGFDFLLHVMNDPRSRVDFKIHIEVTRVPVKE